MIIFLKNPFLNNISFHFFAKKKKTGSDDGSARVWDIASGQCVRILAHRGPLTNAFFAPRYKHLETDKFHPRIIINTFEKKRHDGQLLSAENELNAQVLISCPPLMESLDSSQGAEALSLSGSNASGGHQVSDQVTQNEMGRLKLINRQLYAFAVDKIYNEDAAITTKKRK
jgi:pre-rRNA-processing protein IPI3